MTPPRGDGIDHVPAELPDIEDEKPGPVKGGGEVVIARARRDALDDHAEQNRT